MLLAGILCGKRSTIIMRSPIKAFGDDNKYKTMNKLKNTIHLLYKLANYNMKIIFANRFLIFLIVAVAIFLLFAVSNILDPQETSEITDVYYILLFIGIILIFYPTVFGIQTDVDTRTIELLFGIPNYRYKVWLIRLVNIYILIFGITLLLSLLSTITFVPVNILEMSFQLMFPIFFLGALAFMFSSLIRNGYGTAAIVVIIIIAIWFSIGFLYESKWNVFLNPFYVPSDMDPMIWFEIVFYNRLYLLVGTLLSILLGLYNLQKRERYI